MNRGQGKLEDTLGYLSLNTKTGKQKKLTDAAMYICMAEEINENT